MSGGGALFTGGSSDIEMEDQKEDEDKIATVMMTNQQQKKLSHAGDMDSAGMSKIQVEHQTLMKKHNVRNASEAQKKFLELKTERRELRTKLD